MDRLKSYLAELALVVVVTLSVAGYATTPNDQDFVETAFDLKIQPLNETNQVLVVWFPPEENRTFIVNQRDLTTGAVNRFKVSNRTQLIIDNLEANSDYEIWVTEIDERGKVAGRSVLEELRGDRAKLETLQISPSELRFPTRSAALNANLITLDSNNFPFIFTTVSVDTGGTLVGGLTDANFAAYEDGVLQTDFFDVTPVDSGGGVRLLDFIFLIDNSGSMGPVQQAVKNEVKDFVDSLAALQVDVRLGAVRFGQTQNGGRPILMNNGNMTDDVNFFKSLIDQMTANGGFEPGIEAVENAASQFGFRPGSQRHFLLITDEDSDDGNLANAIALCLANNIVVHTAVDCDWGTSQFDYCNATSIRGATDGLLFNVVGPYDQILEDITRRIGETYIVRYRTFNDVFDAMQRRVDIVVTALAQVDTVTGFYTPGAAPKIVRTQATIDLSNTALVAGTPVTIAAEITDAVAPFVQSATLFFRNSAASTYNSIPMVHIGNDIYEAVIAGSFVTSPGLDYYITATDGQVSSFDPPVDHSIFPYQIAVLPNQPPEITHTPVTSANPGDDVTIAATVVDNTNFLVSVDLHYRKVGTLLFNILAMVPLGNDQYEATIPGVDVTRDGVEYFIRAVDDFGVSAIHGIHTISADTCTFFQMLSVDSDGSIATSNPLSNGVSYKLTASGTYSYWFPQEPTAIADAEWAETTALGDPGWTNPDSSRFELLVDGQDINWGNFNPSHTYSYMIMGTGSPVTFQIIDNFYPDNNGSLAVRIDRCGGQPTGVGPVVYDSHVIDDNQGGASIGDGDGIAENGERIELSVRLFNQGTQTATNVSALIRCNDPDIAIFDSTNFWPDIAPGASVLNSGNFGFDVNPNMTQDKTVIFDLEVFASNGGPWQSSIPVMIVVSGQAELAAQDIFLRPAINSGPIITEPIAGQQYYVHFIWRNDGAGAANNFQIDVRLNDNLVCFFNSTHAVPGSIHENWCSTPVVWPAGTNTLRLRVDEQQIINEQSEKNNNSYRIYHFREFDDFELSCFARSDENLATNTGADYSFVFGYQDEAHYYYVILSRTAQFSRIFKIRDDQRIQIGSLGSFVIPDNDYHEVKVRRIGNLIEVFFDNSKLGFATDSEYGSGGVGIGSYNDSAIFDDICVREVPGGPCLINDDFEDANPDNWGPFNRFRWDVVLDQNDLAYAINTSNFENLDVDRLGELSLVSCLDSLSCVTCSTLTARVDCPANVPENGQFSIDICVDLSSCPPPLDLLGSFSGSLNWDPGLISFAGHSGLGAGFSGSVNDSNAGSGTLSFDGSNQNGVAGDVCFLSLTFDVVGAGNDSGIVDLDFTAMAAADSSVNLLPLLNIDDCSYTITPGMCGVCGDVNDDNVANSTDALIILSYDVGLSIPPHIQDHIDAGCGDVNDDGITNSTDALIILSFDAGLPVPYPIGQSGGCSP